MNSFCQFFFQFLNVVTQTFVEFKHAELICSNTSGSRNVLFTKVNENNPCYIRYILKHSTSILVARGNNSVQYNRCRLTQFVLRVYDRSQNGDAYKNYHHHLYSHIFILNGNFLFFQKRVRTSRQQFYNSAAVNMLSVQ